MICKFVYDDESCWNWLTPINTCNICYIIYLTNCGYDILSHIFCTISTYHLITLFTLCRLIIYTRFLHFLPIMRALRDETLSCLLITIAVCNKNNDDDICISIRLILTRLSSYATILCRKLLIDKKLIYQKYWQDRIAK